MSLTDDALSLDAKRARVSVNGDSPVDMFAGVDDMFVSLAGRVDSVDDGVGWIDFRVGWIDDNVDAPPVISFGHANGRHGGAVS